MQVLGNVLFICVQNYKHNAFVLAPPFFKSWTQRSKTFSMYIKGLFLSNIVHKSVLICVSEHFSFAETNHPPHRCDITRCLLDSMIIAQLWLRLATIKGHSKICSFTVLWGSEQPVSIWWDHHLPHTVQHISFAKSCLGCWLWTVESTPLQWLCKVAGYWQELEHTVVYADPEYPKHAQWFTCPVSRLAMQELGWFQLPGIVYRSLQHGAVHYHAATWGDGHGWMAQQWASGTRHGISVHLKWHQ